VTLLQITIGFLSVFILGTFPSIIHVAEYLMYYIKLLGRRIIMVYLATLTHMQTELRDRKIY